MFWLSLQKDKCSEKHEFINNLERINSVVFYLMKQMLIVTLLLRFDLEICIKHINFIKFSIQETNIILRKISSVVMYLKKHMFPSDIIFMIGYWNMRLHISHVPELHKAIWEK